MCSLIFRVGHRNHQIISNRITFEACGFFAPESEPFKRNFQQFAEQSVREKVVNIG